ncbi:MAG: hypothetical protein NT072_06000 [Deltaproteobacteria bacterium]|nr:hypothetical protein [Deltaproteobacteria bacterium]
MRNRKGRSPELKVGLKYCGGCRAGYHRVAAVERIRERLGDKIEFVSSDCVDCDFVLVVTGCATACVDTASFKGRPIRYIKSEDDVERFITEATGN